MSTKPVVIDAMVLARGILRSLSNRQHVLAPPAEALHHRGVGDAKQDGICRGLVPMRPPRRRRDDIAAAPGKAHAIHFGDALALDDGVDIIRGGATRLGALLR